jgi:hypothetical protein
MMTKQNPDGSIMLVVISGNIDNAGATVWCRFVSEVTDSLLVDEYGFTLPNALSVRIDAALEKFNALNIYGEPYVQFATEEDLTMFVLRYS